MARLTKFGAQQMLLSTFIPLQASMPANLYVALTSAVPPLEASGSTITEPIDGAYTRMEYSLGSDHWGLVGSTTITNLNDIVWPTPTADWGRIAGWALCTDSAGGSVIAAGDLSTPRFVFATSSVVLPAGALRIRMEF